MTIIIGLIVSLLLIGLVVRTGLNKLAETSKFQLFGELVTHVNTAEKVVALTYDDGPNPPYTNQLLDVLERYQAKASFFVVGKTLEKYPEIARRMIASGHELGNHSYSHGKMVSKAKSFIKSEIRQTDYLLNELGVNYNPHFRSPFGLKRVRLPLVLAQMRKKNILWNIDPKDYAASRPESVVEQVISQIKPGSIILLHDGSADGSLDRSVTVAATETIIQKLLVVGYQFKTVSELIALQT